MDGWNEQISPNWNQKPLVDNQGDFFMHVLAMSCNG